MRICWLSIVINKFFLYINSSSCISIKSFNIIIIFIWESDYILSSCHLKKIDNCMTLPSGWWQPNGLFIRLLIFFKWQPDGMSSGSYFQIKIIVGFHGLNRKINPFSIWIMRTGWISSNYLLILEMIIGWYLVRLSNFFQMTTWMSPNSHIKKIVILKFFY